MFFHTYILTKRSPIAKIWLAAHWDRKLTKNDVRAIDLSQSVVQIIEPSVPIALRTSGELMLGVVRVYGHKVRVLLKEASDVAQDLLRAKEVPTTGARTVTKEIPSAVTHAEVLHMDLLLSAPPGTFDAEFDAIANLVLGEKGGLAATIPRATRGDDMGDEWFQPQTSQYQQGLRKLSQEEMWTLQEELGTGKRGREESVPLSERSKKSSSAPSVEGLRKSGQLQQEADMLDIGLPAPDADFVIDVAPPAKTPPPPDIMGGLEEFEPPLKKKTKAHNIVDNAETMVSNEAYHSATADRGDQVGPRRHGPRTEADAFRLQQLEASDMGALGEDATAPWALMQDSFANAVRTRKPWLLAAEHGRGMGSTGVPPAPLDLEMALPPLPEVDEIPFPALPEDPDQLAARNSKRMRDEVANNEATLSELRSASNTKGVTVFRTMMKGKRRAEVARKFADILVLASQAHVVVRQDKPFSEIFVTTVSA